MRYTPPEKIAPLRILSPLFSYKKSFLIKSFLIKKNGAPTPLGTGGPGRLRTGIPACL